MKRVYVFNKIMSQVVHFTSTHKLLVEILLNVNKNSRAILAIQAHPVQRWFPPPLFHFIRTFLPAACARLLRAIKRRDIYLLRLCTQVANAIREVCSTEWLKIRKIRSKRKSKHSVHAYLVVECFRGSSSDSKRHRKLINQRY